MRKSNYFHFRWTLLITNIFKIALPLIVFLAESSAAKNSPRLKQQFKDLASTIQTTASLSPQMIDLSDFRSNAQKGLDFMAPGARVDNLKCLSLANWAPSSAAQLKKYLSELYADAPDILEGNRISTILRQWETANMKLAVMSWEIIKSDRPIPMYSVAVFDSNWRVVFDTELIRFITALIWKRTSKHIDPATHHTAPRDEITGSVDNMDTKSLERKVTVSTLGSTRDWTWRVTATTIISKYVDNQTTPKILLRTDEMTATKGDYSGWLPPPDDPIIWLGRDGTFSDHFSFSVPYKTPLLLTASSDYFENGTYVLEADESGGGIFTPINVNLGMIGFQSSAPFSFIPVSTLKNQIYLGDRVYFEVVPGFVYRGIFWSGGGLKLDKFQFGTGSSDEEVGQFIVDMRVNYGWHIPSGSLFLEDILGSMKLTVDYVRGDHLRKPSVTMTASADRVQVGEIVALDVRIRNESSVVTVGDTTGESQLKLSESFLDGFLPTSPVILALPVIAVGEEKVFQFELEAQSPGTARPSVEVVARWGPPAESKDPFMTTVTLDTTTGTGSIVAVDQTTDISDDSHSEIPSSFSLSQNYPNPFNPDTNIRFQLPKTADVVINIFNTLGGQVRTLVDRGYNAGYYSVLWDGTDNDGHTVSSGVYLYQLKTANFRQVRKMILLR